MEKIRNSKKAQTKINIVSVLVTLVLIVMLVPVIVVFSTGTQQCLEDATPYLQDGYNICSNMSVADNTSSNVSSTNALSTTERTLLGLIGLFIILAFIFNLVKSTGLTKSKG